MTPNKLPRSELVKRYPLDCKIDPTTRTVTVPLRWRREHLRMFIVAPGLPAVWLHKDALPRFIHWVDLMHRRGLIGDVRSVDGGFNPRLKRGRSVPATQHGLSFHAFGCALDINASTNHQGTAGAPLGAPGCVLRLVPLAREAGLVWGGDFGGALIDPMHFEVGR